MLAYAIGEGGICIWVFIDTPDRYLINTPLKPSLTLHQQHKSSTVDQESTNSLSIHEAVDTRIKSR